MKVFKMIVVALLAVSAVACSTTHKAGDCKTAVNGTCLLTYTDSETTVSTGDIDMRFTGLVKNGNEITGTVSTVSHSWKGGKK